MCDLVNSCPSHLLWEWHSKSRKATKTPMQKCTGCKCKISGSMDLWKIQHCVVLGVTFKPRMLVSFCSRYCSHLKGIRKNINTRWVLQFSWESNWGEGFSFTMMTSSHFPDLRSQGTTLDELPGTYLNIWWFTTLLKDTWAALKVSWQLS